MPGLALKLNPVPLHWVSLHDINTVFRLSMAKNVKKKKITHTQTVQRNPGLDFPEVTLSTNPVPWSSTQVPTVLEPVNLRPRNALFIC
jgi:hypothetical protein